MAGFLFEEHEFLLNNTFVVDYCRQLRRSSFPRITFLGKNFSDLKSFYFAGTNSFYVELIGLSNVFISMSTFHRLIRRQAHNICFRYFWSDLTKRITIKTSESLFDESHTIEFVATNYHDSTTTSLKNSSIYVVHLQRIRT